MKVNQSILERRTAVGRDAAPSASALRKHQIIGLTPFLTPFRRGGGVQHSTSNIQHSTLNGGGQGDGMMAGKYQFIGLTPLQFIGLTPLQTPS